MAQPCSGVSRRPLDVATVCQSRDLGNGPALTDRVCQWTHLAKCPKGVYAALQSVLPKDAMLDPWAAPSSVPKDMMLDPLFSASCRHHCDVMFDQGPMSAYGARGRSQDRFLMGGRGS